jgi:DnaK suppressor protein
MAGPTKEPAMTSQPPTLQLDAIEARLRARCEDLLAVLRGSPGPREAQGDVTDFKDQAAEESDEAVLDAELALAREELARASAALRRIHEARYGSCLSCGEAIDARRLEALPEAEFCMACQADRELPQHARRQRA